MIYALVLVILVAAWVSGYFFGYHSGVREGKQLDYERDLEGHFGAPQPASCLHLSHAAYRHGVAECNECGELLVDPNAGDAPAL